MRFPDLGCMYIIGEFIPGFWQTSGRLGGREIDNAGFWQTSRCSCFGFQQVTLGVGIPPYKGSNTEQLLS
jgi:hypothetical protein